MMNAIQVRQFLTTHCTYIGIINDPANGKYHSYVIEIEFLMVNSHDKTRTLLKKYQCISVPINYVIATYITFEDQVLNPETDGFRAVDRTEQCGSTISV